ncbi:MAG: exo-alpha-sialidase [Clostridia bacterium]|nr:exo-alpha-sialidase [Clostridia bacterium]
MGSVFYDLSIYTARKGNDDFPRHSEASIIEIADGGLLMAWQRHEKSAHGSGDEAPSTIALANSYDNGKTWVNERTAVRMDGKCVNVYSPSLLRRKDGSIALFFKRYTHLVWLEPIEAEAKYIVSLDEGKTWSDEYTLWDEPLLAINASFKRISDTSVICPTEIIHSA